MYSEKVIENNLNDFAEREGWRPEPHTIDQVREFKEYIDSVVVIKSNNKNSWIEEVKPLRQPKREEISRWIANEQAMCGLDSNYWETRYAFIRDVSGNIVPFRNNGAQSFLDMIFAESEEAEVSTELLLRSGRQMGITTKIMLKFIHRMLFIPNTTVAICTGRSERSELFNQMTNTIYNMCPWWLVPIRTRKNTFQNGSVNSVQTTLRGSCIGLTPQCLYVPDLDEVVDPVRTIEEGILRSVHSSKKTFIILHGILRSESGWFGSIWRYAKEYWSQGKSRLRPIFLPWMLCSEWYPSSEWIKKYPVPADWNPSKETLSYSRKCNDYANSNFSKFLVSDYAMSLEQMWFWEFQYKQAVATNSVDVFLSQMPCNDGGVDPLYAEEENLDELFPDPNNMQKKLETIRS